MAASTIHTLTLHTAVLLRLLESSDELEVDVRHSTPDAGGNAKLTIGSYSMSVNSDENFQYTLSAMQRIKLIAVLTSAGNQPVSVRFNLENPFITISEILV